MTTTLDIKVLLTASEAKGLLAAALKGADDPTVTDNMLYHDVQALNGAIRKLEILVTDSWGD